MKPRRLELEGFASFRDRTVVDFEGADLFAFTGPTGAGKSSLIDAITFALYGAVPRYEKVNLVWPVVTQGLAEARVRLDFTVGEESYSAVRVVRRTAQGRASTRRAVLERDGEVIADSAKGVSAEVERILGLPFSHFTKCVVLPQGDFARFLHDDSAKRQDLLIKLLDLEIYDDMARAANARAAESDAEASWRRRRLEEDLVGATDEARIDGQVRVSQLEALEGFLVEAGPRLAALREQLEASAKVGAEATAQAVALAALAPVEDDLQLAARLEDGRAAEVAARGAMTPASERRVAAEAVLRGLSGVADLRRLLERHQRTQPLRLELEKAAKEREALATGHAVLEESHDAAGRELSARRRHLEEVTRGHLAANLAETLVSGDLCPVCGVRIEETPHLAAPADLDRARAAVEEAEAALSVAAVATRDAAARVAALGERVHDRERLLADHLAELEGEPEQLEVEQVLPEVEAAGSELEVAQACEKEAAATMARAGELLAGLQESRREAWTRFHERRDALAPMGPPAVDDQDLGKAWSVMAAWAVDEVPKLEQAAVEAGEDAKRREAELRALQAEIEAACEGAGLPSASADPGLACREVLANARRFVERIDEDLDEARRLIEEEKTLRKRAEVARSLVRHLGARRFEAWFLHRAVEGLVVVASEVLRELSRGQYSLRLDEGGAEFLVVDHANADETRLARTLSGGETFLASLALALALSDHVSRLATSGGARLDAIFLDEGFGTLDEDTLEVVAATIEDLGARGHTVGVITHVRELAERMPVRFEVSKGPRTSEVRKVVV